MASLAQVDHRNQDATVYVGNLETACTESSVLELFVQVGRVKSVYMVSLLFHSLAVICKRI
jgi:RNA recognition motif-containing protein